MNRTLRHGRRAAPVLSLAILSVVATAGSAQASGACPDPAVEATVNMDGTTGPGCRASFGYEPVVAGKSRFWWAPAGITSARMLVVGPGGGGSYKNRQYVGFIGGGGSGGAGGGVVQQMVTVDACRPYSIGVGKGAAPRTVPIPVGAVGPELIGYSGYSGGGPSSVQYLDLELQAGSGGGANQNAPLGLGAWGRGGDLAVAFAGGAGSVSGGGGGAGAGTTAATVATVGETGGAGASGIDVSAFFPGLPNAQVGGGGGGFGYAARGAATDGGGSGGTGSTGGDAKDGVDGTGGGGGGGAQEGIGGAYWAAGRGGDGIVVIDFPVPPGGASCTSRGGGSGGSTAATVKATKPKVAAAGTAINVSVTTPAAGTALLTGSLTKAARRVVCTANRSFPGAGTARMSCVPGTAVQRLRQVKAVRVKLVVAFRPATGGATQTVTAGTVTLPKLRARAVPVTG